MSQDQANIDAVLASQSISEVQKQLVMSIEYICSSGVEGDVAEFGTFSGSTAAVLARSLAFFGAPKNRRLNCRSEKRLLLFDSFRGLPKSENSVDKSSLHVQTGVWGEGSCYSPMMTKESLHSLISQFLPTSHFAIFDGWFSDTVPRLASTSRFSLLHIDCDLYQSTVDVLLFMFSRGMVSPGAALLFDDWNCNQASPDFGERRAWAEATKRFDIVADDAGSYGWAGRKFIVHQYTAE